MISMVLLPAPITMRPNPSRRHSLRISALSGASNSEIDPLGQCQAVDALQDQRQVEAELELDDDRRFVTAPSDDVAALDLALDLVTLEFEELLDRRIKRRFAALSRAQRRR